MARPKASRIVREYLETPDDSVPPDAVRLDPDERRAEELAEANIADEEIEELFRVSDEMRTTSGVVLQFVRALPVATAGYVGEMAPSEFTLERVRREFGVGTYRVRVMGPKGYVPGGGKLIIAAVPEKPTVDRSTGVDDVLSILKADKEASGAKLKEWAIIIAPLLTPVITSWLTPKNQVNDLVQGLAALKDLQPKEKPPEPLAAQIDAIAGIMGKLKELAGDEKTTTGATWIDLIRDAISGVKPILEQVAGRALGAVPNRGAIPMMVQPIPVQLPGPAPGVVGAPVTLPTGANGGGVAQGSDVEKDATMPAAGPVGVISLLPWLSATLQQLIVQAARNRDPELYAEVTLDNMPEGVDPKQLIPFLERPDWWAQLQQFSPQVAPYPAWFADYREAVLAILKEDAAQVPEVVPAQTNYGTGAGGEIHEGQLQPGDVEGDGM